MRKIQQILGTSLLLILAVGEARADWQFTLTATGEVNPAPYVFSVSLGDSSEALLLPAPPRPPQYATYVELYEPDWISGPYLVMIYAPTVDSLIWLLQIDPNGNVVPPDPRTTVISWDSRALPDAYNFSIVDYLTSQMVVPDMHAQGSFSVTGTEDQYFNVIAVPSASGVTNSPNTPLAYALISAHPNPFNPTATFSYQLSANSFVNLQVYDIKGKTVAELVNGWREAGMHEITFDGSALASGILFFRLQTGQYQSTGKIVLMK